MVKAILWLGAAALMVAGLVVLALLALLRWVLDDGTDVEDFY